MDRVAAKGLCFSRSGWNAEFSFDVAQGSWVSLVGPSGAGKTTLLELMAGFERAETGGLFFGRENILEKPVHKRLLAYVFQQNALFPSLTAFDNLLLALHDSDLSRADKRDSVLRMAKRVGMGHRLSHKPGELSGGELARMNLARALLRPAKMLLLDEPFAALDTALRREMNGLVRELHGEKSLTTFCVTHHPEDAFLFADHVMVFARGKIVAQGTPDELAKAPPSAEVASILDAGNVVSERDGDFYVRHSQLTCEKNLARSFQDAREVVFQNWKFAHTGDGTVVVCLDSGRSYVLSSPHLFEGKLYFDASSAVKFQKSATVVW
jgi:ABC-type Fe3+/spermidine/putrescine transport system ATPase subunit